MAIALEHYQVLSVEGMEADQPDTAGLDLAQCIIRYGKEFAVRLSSGLCVCLFVCRRDVTLYPPLSVRTRHPPP
eukprot:6172797-Pyramimonas_sp.AAC.1